VINGRSEQNQKSLYNTKHWQVVLTATSQPKWHAYPNIVR